MVRRIEELKAAAGVGALPTGITTGQYLAEWLEHERVRVRPSTWRQREQYVRTYIVPSIGSTPLARLAPADAERVTTTVLKSGKSARTAASARVILRGALADGLRDGPVTRNVAALARPPRAPSRDRRGSRLPRHAESSPAPPCCADRSVGPAVVVAATVGLGLGEVLGPSWSDVRLDAPAILTVR